MGKEIITLAFGSYASQISLHFWNIQEEIFHLRNDGCWRNLLSHLSTSSLYRETGNENMKNSRYPRTVIVDCCNTENYDSFDSIKIIESKMDSRHRHSHASLWTNDNHSTEITNIKKCKHDPEDQLSEQMFEEYPLKSEQKYRQKKSLGRLECSFDAFPPSSHYSDNTVIDFTRFVNSRFHEKSILKPKINGASSTSFSYGEGFKMATKTDFYTDWENRIRFFAEECDTMQGFLSIVDVLSGFAGCAASFLESLQDEYPGTPIFSLGLSNTRSSADFSEKYLSNTILNTLSSLQEALLIANLSQCVSLHVPIDCPHNQHINNLRWETNNSHQTSAVLACLLDTLTLPPRMVSTYENSRFGSASRYETDLRALSHITLENGKSTKLGHIIAAVNVPTLDLKESEFHFIHESFTGLQYKYNSESNKLCQKASEWIVSRGASMLWSPESISNIGTSQALISKNGVCDSMSLAKRLIVTPTPIPIPREFPSEILGATMDINNKKIAFSPY
eukprot:gnl/TRDRNA2_/TRDRNA2_177956_c1_seq1.p1 gnl/TRDRNA2_/TRDRNA2_177956_c1~~gnl/TRDRNA2_/TRDRNA2_177956_c1_seq1.p1  ORF type:complete len:506 (-),score=-51.73 gnl/TRDRNA2_/TRDRNA2_177956_c1_seq1:604-2121(-)